jgi:hypothetical protein
VQVAQQVQRQAQILNHPNSKKTVSRGILLLL